MTTVFGLWVLFGPWILLTFSLIATSIHGGQEVEGWWEKRHELTTWIGQRAWLIFLAVQLTFVALAIVGFGWYEKGGETWPLWLIGSLAAFKWVDAIGFHLLFYPEWPGRETLVLPLADALILTLWMVA